MREVESTGEINIQRELLMKTNFFFFLMNPQDYIQISLSPAILYTEDTENGILLKNNDPISRLITEWYTGKTHLNSIAKSLKMELAFNPQVTEGWSDPVT